MPNEPIRQHWVPKVYLRAFCSDPAEQEQIHVRDAASGTNFVTSLDRVAVKKHFYTLSLGTEDQSYAVEEAHSKIESGVSSVLEAIRADQQLPTDPSAMSILCRFVATLHMRTRQGLKMIHGHREEVRARAGGQASNSAHARRFESDLIEYDDEEMRELFAKASVVVGERIATMLQSMHWRLLRATDSYFITSENPVYSYHPTEARWGIGTPGAFTLFPVSPSLLIHLSNEALIPGTGVTDVPPQGVRGLNGLTLLAAEQFIFSHRPLSEVSDLFEERQAGRGRAFGPVGGT